MTDRYLRVRTSGGMFLWLMAMNPDSLLHNYLFLFTEERPGGPVLDLACGDGHNGIFLASRGLSVVLADKSEEALEHARKSANDAGVSVKFWKVDLEQEGINPLPVSAFGAILVFRYLHRPLIPCIKKSLVDGGILIYETFTSAQAGFGKPCNPDHLLHPEELIAWFADWEVLHSFEGIAKNPQRSIAQIVCRKPGRG